MVPTPTEARWEIREGDCRDVLASMPAGSAQTCVTSPPYFGLRDYGHDGQIGLEGTPDEFVAAMVAVFREVRRVLRDDGTVWLNLGDSYAGSWGAQGRTGQMADRSVISARQIAEHPRKATRTGAIPSGADYKAKDLIGIPWMVAFALRADGWYLRSDIVWHKPNPMPESVQDRPTRSHEFIFLLTKSPRYYYNADAIREAATDTGRENGREGRSEPTGARPPGSPARTLARVDYTTRGRNKRDVWTVTTKPYAGAHFATFPPDLIEPCVLAGAPAGGVVLDPFAGAGTTGMVALRHGRSFVGVELNAEYAALARDRIRDDAPLFNAASEDVAA